MIRTLLFVCLLSLSLLAHAKEDPLAALKKGQPADVVDIVDRIVGCSHWAGEEAYNAKRKEQILEAMRKLKCEQISRDDALTTKRYANQPKVIETLKKAREWNY